MSRALPRGAAAAAVVVVLVTALAAVVAGTASGGETLHAGTGTLASLGQRTFTCTAGLRDTHVLSGSSSTGVEDRAVTHAERITLPEVESRGAFAAQVAHPPGGFAMALCPEPRNEWWFVGAGASVTHSSVLTVSNPRPGAAVIDIEVLGTKGPVKGPGLQGVTLAGHSSRSYRLPDVAPATGDLVVHVHAIRGLVSAAATDSFATSSGVGAHVHEWLPDQYRPDRTVTLTGLQRRPARADLLLANPGDTATLVSVEVLGEKGPFSPQGVEQVPVPAHTVVRRNLAAAFDGHAAAVRLHAPVPILGTVRSLRAGDDSFATSAAPLRGVSVVALPGADSRDLVLSGLAKGTVRVVAYAAHGRRLGEQHVAVTPQVSQLVKVPAGARYLLLATGRPVAVAGVLVSFDHGGVAGIAVPPAARALRVPAVRPAW